ncbi:hypothetical protein K525DRAFT_214235 [Schizophyllum commune Loenen D]|nr:hypothetical protein K525DRAFT_214235 [Schizophyllum commune Loenen D]
MLVSDILHEFELGVWQSVLIHLIRMLESLGGDILQTFNARFRQIPTFGHDTIRRFERNVSSLTRMAARDYEDILQSCISPFEGLFPAHHESRILDLLYLLVYWHSLGKLRLHLTSTVNIIDHITTELGKALRYFADVICPEYKTYETEKEYGARKRADARRTAPETNDVPATLPSTKAGSSTAGRRLKTFTLQAIKLHFLGDVAGTIEKFGSLESVSTKTGELEHRTVKKRRARVSNKGVIPQLASAEVRERVHDRMKEELDLLSVQESGDVAHHVPPEPLLVTSELRVHHRIAKDESGTKYHLADWLGDHQHDPAFKDFLPKLRAHLLARMQGRTVVCDEPEYLDSELDNVHIQHNRLYPHATATFNYTSYDVRRDQDIIHVPSDSTMLDTYLGHRDVMVRSNDDADDAEGPAPPFWYARVLKIFHANVSRGDIPSERPRRMEFLFVRWLGLDPEHAYGPSAMRLERVGYVAEDHPSGAFGFLDPAQVIRACHLIPAFHFGHTFSLLGPSAFRDSRDGDWVNYYVNRFVDRDMMMRYLGVGIGHLNPPDFPHEVNQLPFVEDSPFSCSQREDARADQEQEDENDDGVEAEDADSSDSEPDSLSD